MNPNMMLNRPSYLDYGNNDTKKQEPTKTQAKPYEVILSLFSKTSQVLKELIQTLTQI